MPASSGQRASAIETKSFPNLPPVHWTERYFRLVWGAVGIVGVVVAEFFMSSKGLGYFINLKANALEIAPAFVAIVLLALFGIALVSLVTYIENRFCNW